MNGALRVGVVAAALLCLVASAVAGAGTGTDPGATADRTPDPLHPAVDTDRVKQIVAVGPDGTAEWQVNYVTEIGTDRNESEAFDDLAADVRENPDNYTERFAERIRRTVDVAENATGRGMRAGNFSVSTRRDAVNGIVTYTFEWTNFAAVRDGGNRVVVGDAVEGYFLNPDTTLQVRWPEGWTATEVVPSPDSTPGRAVVWRGATTDFGPDQPRVVIEPAAATPTGTETATSAATPTAAGTDGGGGTPATPTDPGPGGTDTGTPGSAAAGDGGEGGLPVGLLAVTAAVVAAVGVAWWRRPSGGSRPGPGSDAGPADDAAGADAVAPDGSAAAGVDDGNERERAPASDADGTAGGAAADEELLSNEERVLRLLEERGGRTKQQEVVDALGWTEAKTSQVVSGMREDGAIDSFRLGRENVLTLPDEGLEPTDDEDQN